MAVLSSSLLNICTFDRLIIQCKCSTCSDLHTIKPCTKSHHQREIDECSFGRRWCLELAQLLLLILNICCSLHQLLPIHALHCVGLLFAWMLPLARIEGRESIYVAQLRHIPLKRHRHLPQILRHERLLKRAHVEGIAIILLAVQIDILVPIHAVRRRRDIREVGA